MKKYVKPMIVYENFELSHCIANCSPAMNHSQKDCTYDSDELFGLLNSGETVFNESSCTYTLEWFKEKYEGYCMQTGSGDYNLFTS